MSSIREEELNIPPIIQCMSINQGAMKAVQELNQAAHFGSSALTRVQMVEREGIRAASRLKYGKYASKRPAVAV